MKCTILVLKISFFVSVCALIVFAAHYYLSVKENTALINKYSVMPTHEEVVESDMLTEQQQAASIRAKTRQSQTNVNRSKANSVSATTTVSSKNPQPLATSTILTTQKTITGIAAGGVLAGMSEKQIRNYFDTLKKLGITWVRWDMNWAEIQRDGSNSYDWVGVDLVVKIAKEYNIKSLVILGYAPTWASEPGCTKGQQCAPKEAQLFANFATQAALRYKGDIHTWEIWNEPNSTGFWSPQPSVAKYAEVLKESYSAIKKVDSSAVVITGGLSPVEGNRDTIDPVTFVTELYKINGNSSFDAISLHPYAYPLSPASTKPWNYWFQMYKVYDVMNKNGDSGKKIWITEYGAPTGGSGSSHEIKQIKLFAYGQDFMSEKAQAIMLSDLITEVNKIRTWVGPVFWYSLTDTDSLSTDPEGHFGLITSQNYFKQAYFVLLNAGK
jgi:GH35 family endo-1,4-beta-xylanase